MKRALMCVCVLTAVLQANSTLLALPKKAAPTLAPGADVVLNGRKIGTIPLVANGFATVPLSTGERLTVHFRNGQIVSVQAVDRLGRFVPARFQTGVTVANGQPPQVVIAIIAILIGL